MWEIHVGQEVFYLSDTNFNEMLEQEKQGIRLVKIGSKTINPAFVSSAKKVYEKPGDMFYQPSWVHETPVKLTDDQIAKRDKIKSDIKAMLKKKNENWKNTNSKQSSQPKLERYQVKEALIDEMRGMNFPNESNYGWKPNKLITGHSRARESHIIKSFTYKIDTGLSDYENDFEIEAAYTFCSECNKYLVKELRLYDHTDPNVTVIGMI
jgi:hypothetical protein